MCGLVGYVGEVPAGGVILNVLEKLESRGYDSVGGATLNEDGILDIRRVTGKVGNLVSLLEETPLKGNIGIGHTRWSTHGKATIENTHPHVAGKVAVVHNGTITNSDKLRKELRGMGYRFLSNTDTEVIPQLVNYFLDAGHSPIKATRLALQKLEGAYALALLFEGYDNLLIVARRGSSPLVVGFGKSGTFAASTSGSLVALADRVLRLESGDMAVLTREGSVIYDTNDKVVSRSISPIKSTDVFSGKEGFPHYMLKEIHQQPTVIEATLQSLRDPLTGRIVLPEGMPFDFADVSQILIVACGTAKFAGDVAKSWFEKFARIPVICVTASEFVDSNPPPMLGQVGIVISQSGETADTLNALRLMQSQGIPVLAIINAADSEMQILADETIRTLAGPEIAVASTKAFTTQLSVLASLAIAAARLRGKLSVERELELMRELDSVPALVQSVLDLDGSFRTIADLISDASDVFYVGRKLSAIAYEGALKLMEISYIHAHAFAAGELKHGPIALATDAWFIALAPRDDVFTKTATAIHEIEAKGGKVIVLSDAAGCEALSAVATHSVALPTKGELSNPIAYAVATQLIAYHTAIGKGIDPDQPRNLAKSVTVE